MKDDYTYELTRAWNPETAEYQYTLTQRLTEMNDLVTTFTGDEAWAQRNATHYGISMPASEA